MKPTNLLFLSLVFLTTSSCFTNRLVETEQEHRIEEENYTITLTNVAQNGVMNAGAGPGSYQYVKDETNNKPGKFFKATVILTNNTDQMEVIDLRNIMLCGEDKNCLKPYEFHMKSIIDGYVDATLKLKAGKEKGRELYYLGPGNFIPKFVMNQKTGKFITFEYKK